MYHCRAPKGLVEITIPSGKTFTLHIDVLVEKCDYFRAALTGNFVETTTKQLKLPDVSDNTFAFFLKWVYAGNLKPEHDPNRCNVHNESSLTVPGFLDLWFFADYVRAPALQNHVVTNLVGKFQNFRVHSTEERLKQITESIRMLWMAKGRTDRGEIAKPLRDLILEFVANPDYMPQAKAERLVKTVPAYFLREFALTTVERNFFIEAKTSAAVQALAPPNEDSDEDFLEDDFECIYEKLESGLEVMSEAQQIWEIKPENYFVKDVKKAQEAN